MNGGGSRREERMREKVERRENGERREGDVEIGDLKSKGEKDLGKVEWKKEWGRNRGKGGNGERCGRGRRGVKRR